MVEDFTLVPGAGQEVVCPGCGSSYDGNTVPFCDCLASINGPVCPSCGKCTCKLSKEDQAAFWQKAPPALFRRRLEDRKASAGIRPAHLEKKMGRPLVLVADDDAVTRRVAQRVLEKMGYGVIVAERGDEALQLALAHLPDVVLTDALMPKLDGRELCLRLKNLPEMAHAKVIIMTGLFTKSQSKYEAFQDFKADAFLKKPVEVGELKKVLDELAPLPNPTTVDG